MLQALHRFVAAAAATYPTRGGLLNSCSFDLFVLVTMFSLFVSHVGYKDPRIEVREIHDPKNPATVFAVAGKPVYG